MYLDNLRVMTPRPQQCSMVTRLWVIFSALLTILFCSNISAQTLLDEIELPKPTVLQSGVPIPDLDEAARRAIVLEDDQQSQRPNFTDIREYQLGDNLVREYRYGKQLLYVEMTNAAGSTYVVEHNRPFISEDRKPRAGVIVSTW